MPSGLPDTPVAPDRVTKSTPAKPTARPSACRRPGARRRSRAASAAEKRGMEPLIAPAIDESTHCWAMGKSRRGTAIHTRPRRAMRGQSARSTLARVPGKIARAAAPRRRRLRLITAGAKCSRPSAIHRKDDPHMRAMAARSPHSRGPKASGRVPGAVVRTGRRVTGGHDRGGRRPRARDRQAPGRGRESRPGASAALGRKRRWVTRRVVRPGWPPR